MATNQTRLFSFFQLCGKLKVGAGEKGREAFEVYDSSYGGLLGIRVGVGAKTMNMIVAILSMILYSYKVTGLEALWLSLPVSCVMVLGGRESGR